MKSEFFQFESTLWIRNNGVQTASRHFFTLPKELSQKIKSLGGIPLKLKSHGGMIKIESRIARYTRTTSIFRDKKTGTYLLPVKAQVRKDLHLRDKDTRMIEISLT